MYSAQRLLSVKTIVCNVPPNAQIWSSRHPRMFSTLLVLSFFRVLLHDITSVKKKSL